MFGFVVLVVGTGAVSVYSDLATYLVCDKIEVTKAYCGLECSAQ